MFMTTDIIKIPTGYSNDIQELCSQVLEVALLRGENHKSFDEEFLFELLDKEFETKEQDYILKNAKRYLSEGIRSNDNIDVFLFSQEEFETGCKEFVMSFLYLNQLNSNVANKKDTLSISLKPINDSMWGMTCTSVP